MYEVVGFVRSDCTQKYESQQRRIYASESSLFLVRQHFHHQLANEG